MARAKRTNRAEARRNYRAAMAASPDELGDADLEEATDADATAEPASRTSQPKSPLPTSGGGAGAAPGARPSIQKAFRGAFRPLDLRGDLQALPRLLIDKAFLIPVALIVGVTVAVVVFQGKELISRELSAFVLSPPPLAPVFIAGFLAPRASWLLGGLLGVVQTVAVLIVISTPALGQLTGVPDAGTLLSSVFVSVVFGSFYAAAMAWYKRFLRNANPPRNAASKSPAGKPKQGRPMLAKRR